MQNLSFNTLWLLESYHQSYFSQDTIFFSKKIPADTLFGFKPFSDTFHFGWHENILETTNRHDAFWHSCHHSCRGLVLLLRIDAKLSPTKNIEFEKITCPFSQILRGEIRYIMPFSEFFLTNSMV